MTTEYSEHTEWEKIGVEKGKKTGRTDPQFYANFKLLPRVIAPDYASDSKTLGARRLPIAN